jgi:hypothetical protein
MVMRNFETIFMHISDVFLNIFLLAIYSDKLGTWESEIYDCEFWK